jgi:hypothetical protein
MSTRNIDNNEDVLDSRDVIARIDELESELREQFEAELNTGSDFEKWLERVADQQDFSMVDEAVELQILRSLAEEGAGSPDWAHGETLIRDSYFVDYAEQLADDIDAIKREANWPLNCIDWEKAAEQLKADYFSVEFDGVTYWVRS